MQRETRQNSSGRNVAGQERCIAWRRGTQARPVVPSPNQNCDSAAAPRASRPAVVAGGTSGESGSLKRRVPIGSARSRPDGMGTIGAGEAARTGAVTTARGGRSRGTRGGVLARRADRRGSPPGPKP